MTPDEEAQNEEAAPAEVPVPTAAAAEVPEDVAEPAEPLEADDADDDGPAPDGRSGESRPRGRGDRDADDDRGYGGGRRRFFGRRKVCAFCVDKAEKIDYKDPAKLRRYVSDRGRIEGRRRTGTCAKHQRWLAIALKRARHLALLPYSPEHIRVTGAFASRR